MIFLGSIPKISAKKSIIVLGVIGLGAWAWFFDMVFIPCVSQVLLFIWVALLYYDSINTITRKLRNSYNGRSFQNLDIPKIINTFTRKELEAKLEGEVEPNYSLVIMERYKQKVSNRCSRIE